MTTTPDFSKLYTQLNLRPDCSLEDFKHAYRRKVATLHPDRRAAGGSPSANERIPLSDLMSLYNLAMQFQREHGRLPGAPLPGKITPTLRPSREVPAPAAGTTTLESPDTGSPPRMNWLVLAALMGLLGYLVVSSLPDAPAGSTAVPHAVIRPEATAQAQSQGDEQLAIGMDAATVLSIQGTPSRTSEELWEYGPSWIRFEKGLVVGWYSSPLYRLRSSGQQAPGRPPTER